MPKNARNYLVVTAAYWSLTLTDGALRMLVLLHFHGLGYSPFELALLFLLYEMCGVVTNLFGGWFAARLGLKTIMCMGLALQIAALGLLSGLSASWSQDIQVLYVIAAQGLSGIAKDFTKLGAKSSIKVLVPSDQHGLLFKWVALLTGSKNTLKGVGFFAGALLLDKVGFQQALWIMGGGILVALVASATLLPKRFGKPGQEQRLSQLFSKTRAINLLSLARFFLFGARDVWFVVALPVFMTEVLGWSFVLVGSYMALWVIGYGLVQALTPKIVSRTPETNDARTAQVWGFVLSVIPVGICGLLVTALPAKFIVLVGLGVFGVIFAINSTVHSYLILAYSQGDDVATNVGFYYMANAGGRFFGTLLSGFMYQYAALPGCLLVSSAMIAAASILALGLPNPRTADVH